MKIENIICNSSLSFTGFTENDTYHGILLEAYSSISLNKYSIPGINLSLKQLKKDASITLEEGVYFTMSYSNDNEDQEYLELLLQKFFAGFSQPVSLIQIEGIINIIKRFQNKKKTLTGLIGELIFILSSKEKNAAIQAWHISKDSIFDFNFRSEIYEIKCTLNLQRKHKLNHAQNLALTAVKDKGASYVSIILNRNFPTNSIDDLISQISNQIDEDLRLLFETKLEPYGDLTKSKMKFDIESTLKSLRIFKITAFKNLVTHNDSIDPHDITYSINFNLIQ